jgi:uncharacterized protein YjiS (DUF1127 family)
MNMSLKTQEYDFDRDYRLSARDQALMARGEAIADLLAATVGAVSTIAARLFAPIKTWAIERSTRDELMSLDDRTLADIGLTRGDIPQVASGLWVPENRLAQIRAAQVTLASNANNRPQVAA